MPKQLKPLANDVTIERKLNNMQAAIDLVSQFPLFFTFITIAIFLLAGKLQEKTGFILFNPLLFTTIAILLLLLLFNIPYESYQAGGSYISVFINLATVSLAVLLEKNWDLFKANITAILTGAFIGVLTNAVLVVLIGVLSGLDQSMLATLLPKSITTPIAQAISESLGGFSGLTVGIVVLTGILGNAFGVPFLKAIKVTDPIAQGNALGGTSHAMGTASAIELGDLQGGIGGASIVISGLITVLVAPIAYNIATSLFF